MIAEWFMNWGAALVHWIAGVMGNWTPPDQLVHLADGVNSLLTGMAGFGVWVDFGVLTGCVGVQVAVWTTVLIIKALRWLVGLIPTMGGGT